MAAVGLAARGMVVRPSTATATGSCMPTIRITATTGIGIIKQIAVEVIIWPISDWRANLLVLKMIFKLWTGRAAHAR